MTNVTLRSGSSETLGSGDDPLTAQLGLVRRSRTQTVLRLLTDPASMIPTCVGVVIVLAGFGLIGYGWSQIAGLVDVWRQMPYLVSAGLPGLGLILSGLVLINVSARRQDSAARARQMETLTEAMRDLQQALDR